MFEHHQRVARERKKHGLLHRLCVRDGTGSAPRGCISLCPLQMFTRPLQKRTRSMLGEAQDAGTHRERQKETEDTAEKQQQNGPFRLGK